MTVLDIETEEDKGRPDYSWFYPGADFIRDRMKNPYETAPPPGDRQPPPPEPRPSVLLQIATWISSLPPVPRAD